jgi:hypothetical protein
MLELAVTAGGAIMGFVMKLMAAKQERDARLFEQALRMHQAVEASHAQAATREPGVWIRRAIVLAILFAVVVVPTLAGVMDIPLIVESQESWTFLFLEGTKTVFTELRGLFVMPEVRLALLSIIGFYFGQGTVRR